MAIIRVRWLMGNTGKCPDCGEEVERKKRWQHMMDKHPQKYEAYKASVAIKRQIAKTASKASKASTADKPPKPLPTTVLTPGEVFHVTPKAFTTASTLFWQAMDVAIKKWGWPKNMTPQQFLDAVLFYYCKRRGALIGGWVDLEEDGHRKHTEEELQEALSRGVAAALARLKGG